MQNGKEFEFKFSAAMVGSVINATRNLLALMPQLITSLHWRGVAIDFQHLTCARFADLATHLRRIADRFPDIHENL
jgi:hypothetical protein